MRKRVCVLLDESELREIHRLAKREGMTVTEWVQQALRIYRKLQVVRAAAKYSFPTAEPEEMLAQIGRGYADRQSR